MSRPGWVTYTRDTLTFMLGMVIILKQAGILFDPPSSGPSAELLTIGALCCNVPGILQVIAWRAGISSQSSQPASSVPSSPSAPASTAEQTP